MKMISVPQFFFLLLSDSQRIAVFHWCSSEGSRVERSLMQMLIK